MYIENMDMKDRIKALGLNQKKIAELLGKQRHTISRQLNGGEGMKVTHDLESLVLALEMLKEENRLEDYLFQALPTK
ncbi:conserved hypothetical protein [Candidatus Terasakiella magnetica]|uniref:HTH cro/C1-type domain-containing protein n=1 Tax=Candidatus Terasakiella magnetica TaxID=1867952 RepID=A0A1C3RLF3_9PROT|nr:hypothetical protein [Candidatus Terasakiella magnetica]SCA58105.1 conserved hypothetical protein [Candidatus Terasakiella magnetica]